MGNEKEQDWERQHGASVATALGAPLCRLNICVQLCRVTVRGRISSSGPSGTVGFYCPENELPALASKRVPWTWPYGAFQQHQQESPSPESA